jgi:hypothetical protein
MYTYQPFPSSKQKDTLTLLEAALQPDTLHLTTKLAGICSDIFSTYDYKNLK